MILAFFSEFGLVDCFCYPLDESIICGNPAMSGSHFWLQTETSWFRKFLRKSASTVCFVTEVDRWNKLLAGKRCFCAKASTAVQGKWGWKKLFWGATTSQIPRCSFVKRGTANKTSDGEHKFASCFSWWDEMNTCTMKKPLKQGHWAQTTVTELKLVLSHFEICRMLHSNVPWQLDFLHWFLSALLTQKSSWRLR